VGQENMAADQRIAKLSNNIIGCVVVVVLEAGDLEFLELFFK
jgi:hypothetical protein